MLSLVLYVASNLWRRLSKLCIKEVREIQYTLLAVWLLIKSFTSWDLSSSIYWESPVSPTLLDFSYAPNSKHIVYTPKHCKYQDSDNFHNFLDPNFLRNCSLNPVPFHCLFSSFVSVIHHLHHPLLLSPFLVSCRSTTPAQSKSLPVVTYMCTPGTS
jgi:hypothetical protein